MDMEEYNVVPAEEILGKKEEPINILGKTSIRIFAELADICLTMILGIILYMAAFSPAFGYDRLTAQMAKISTKLVSEQVDASLTVQRYDGTVYTEDEFVTKLLDDSYGRSLATPSSTDEYLYKYYGSYRKAGLYTIGDYNTKVLGLPATLTEKNESTLFIYDTRVTDPLNSLGILSSDAVKYVASYKDGVRTAEVIQGYKDVKTFYTNAYETAFQEFRLSQPYYGHILDFASLQNTRAYMATGASLTSYLVSALVFFVVIPLCLKGQTLGKKIMKLEPRGNGGLTLHAWQTLARGVVEMLEYVFEVPFEALLVFGFDSFALPLFVMGKTTVTMMVLLIAGVVVTLVSTLFLAINKRHQSFHDLASLTNVYTTDYAIIDSERAKREAAKENQ
jgi:uncharacterized RDD family membrane protein YckC